MTFEVHVYHHLSDGAESAVQQKLDEILSRLSAIHAQGVQIMSKQQELEQELGEINQTTNELAADVDDLLAQNVGGLTAAEADAHKAKLQEIKAALQAVASKHTPVTPPTT